MQDAPRHGMHTGGQDADRYVGCVPRRMHMARRMHVGFVTSRTDASEENTDTQRPIRCASGQDAGKRQAQWGRGSQDADKQRPPGPCASCPPPIHYACCLSASSRPVYVLHACTPNVRVRVLSGLHTSCAPCVRLMPGCVLRDVPPNCLSSDACCSVTAHLTHQ